MASYAIVRQDPGDKFVTQALAKPGGDKWTTEDPFNVMMFTSREEADGVCKMLGDSMASVADYGDAFQVVAGNKRSRSLS